MAATITITLMIKLVVVEDCAKSENTSQSVDSKMNFSHSNVEKSFGLGGEYILRHSIRVTSIYVHKTPQQTVCGNVI
jgi:hypothetical protein